MATFIAKDEESNGRKLTVAVRRYAEQTAAKWMDHLLQNASRTLVDNAVMLKLAG